MATLFNEWSVEWEAAESDYSALDTTSAEYGDALLELDPPSAGRRALSWDVVGPARDIECLTLTRLPAFDTDNNGYCRTYARIDGDAGNESAYFFVIRDSAFALRKYAGGSLSTLASGGTPSAGTKYWVRLDVNNTGTGANTIRARYWEFGESEPTTWDFDVSESGTSVPDVGRVGLGGYADVPQEFDWFGVGTGGAAAPEPTIISAQVADIELGSPAASFSDAISAQVADIELGSPAASFSAESPPTARQTLDRSTWDGTTVDGTRPLTAQVAVVNLGSPAASWTSIQSQWALDGAPMGTLVSERRTWQDLTLTLRADESTRANTLSALRESAGEFDTLTRSDGSFVALDRASVDGVYELIPPTGRNPPRTSRDYVAVEYSERPLEQRDAAFEVRLRLRATTNRDPDGTATDETRASDEWALDCRAAQITTRRVTADREASVTEGADVERLTLILDATQTKVWEESITRLAAVSTRTVPDGLDTTDDDSEDPAGSNTVSVTTPDGEQPIPDGNYVVREWTTEYLTADAYRVDVTLGHP